MAWTNLDFPFGSILTSAKMTQMDDNFDAVAQGLSGAPKIQTAAYADLSVTNAKLAGSISNSKLLDIASSKLTDYPWGSEDIRAGSIQNGNLINGNVGAEKFQTGTTEVNWVLARTAGATRGVVGSYATMSPNSGIVGSGSTVAGSSIRHSNNNASSGFGASGTWVNVSDAVASTESATMLRIS